MHGEYCNKKNVKTPGLARKGGANRSRSREKKQRNENVSGNITPRSHRRGNEGGRHIAVRIGHDPNKIDGKSHANYDLAIS